MLRLVLLTVFVLAETEDLIGVNYSFDVDFYTNFNRKRCDNENMWRLVTYESIGIKPPFNSEKGIQAIGVSCASSFPIIFVGGTLEINVYSQDISQMLNLIIEVLDENDVCVTNYMPRPSRKRFETGWQTVSLKINKHVKGYIHLRGKSLNEILLIDSFRYTPNNTVTFKRLKRSISDIEEDEFIFEKESNNQYKVEEIESSGDNEHETEDTPTTDKPGTEVQGRDTIWNPFTISLVSFGVFVAVALLVVAAYHYGKVKAADRVPLPFVDQEPPRTITIPRVAGRSNRSSPSTMYNYSNF